MIVTKQIESHIAVVAILTTHKAEFGDGSKRVEMQIDWQETLTGTKSSLVVSMTRDEAIALSEKLRGLLEVS